MSRLRVCYIAHSVSPSGGGMERQGRELIKALADDVDFTVVASEGLDSLPDGVRTVRVPLPRRPAFVRIGWFYLRGASALRRLGPFDVVHSCGAIVANPVDAATVHLCQAAAARVGRSGGSRIRRANAAVARRLGLALERRTYRAGRVRTLVAVSAFVEAQVRAEYPGVRVSRIEDGVDVSRFDVERARRSSAGSLVAVLVSGDHALKGVDVAIEAVARVPGVILRVVGRGPDEPYRRLAERSGAGARVEILGPLADVREVYRNSDVVLGLSRYDSFGLSLVEGALAGCAVVASPVGVARELVDEDGGVIVERDPVAVAAALTSLRDDPERCEQAGERARDRARTYTIERMAESYLELYRELAEAK